MPVSSATVANDSPRSTRVGASRMCRNRPDQRGGSHPRRRTPQVAFQSTFRRTVQRGRQPVPAGAFAGVLSVRGRPPTERPCCIRLPELHIAEVNLQASREGFDAGAMFQTVSAEIYAGIKNIAYETAGCAERVQRVRLGSRCNVLLEYIAVYTVGYNYVRIFDTPGCRNTSRDDSRQYQHSTRSRDWTC
jgi:hypothetical protein